MFQPTQSQRSVLDTKQKNIVVSASAGSGKTTLMIEKVIKIIEDEKADISKFLICTFTKSAGEEMKARLYEKIAQKISESKDEKIKKLFTQTYEKLELAKICTIDKLCLDLVKKYFYELKLDPNIENLSEFDANFLKNRAFSKTFEDFEASDKQVVDILCAYFLQDRDLVKLKELTFNIYENLQTRPNGKEFYNQATTNLYEYSKIIEIIENKLKLFEVGAVNLINIYNDALRFLDFNDDKVLIQRLNNDINILQSYFNFDIKNKIKFIFGLNINSVLKKTDNYDNDKLKENKNALKDVQDNLIDFFGSSDLDEIILKCSKSGEILKLLGDFIFKFAENFKNFKQNQNQYEFNDIQHFALKLLKNPKIKQDIVKDIDYIFVDEYQDVNYLQEELIDNLVKCNNLFLVGDAKQSIYGFRLCTPKILLAKSQKFESDDNAFAVNLNENFRSDKEILEFTNQIFNEIMTKDLSGVDYKNTSNLQGSISYDNELCFPKVKIDVILKKEDEEKKVEEKIYILENAVDVEANSIENEASHIANLVGSCLQEKIYDAKLGYLRNVTFGDIAVLFRRRKDLYKEVVNKLTSANIPLTVSYKEDIFESFEVKFVNAVLSLVMNFNDDVSLLTVLSFPSIGVTDDELAEVRAKCDDEYFSNAVLNYTTYENANKEIVYKLQKLQKLLNILNTKMYVNTVYELIKEIESYFDIQNVLYALKNSKVIANYSKFLNEIKSSKFTYLIDYLHYLSIRDKSDSEINVSGGEDSVRCITIHESKGLEYPIVIFAGSGDSIKFKNNDICINEYGIGCDFYNTIDKWKVPTIIKNAINENLKLAEIEEGKRLLYVALTRAKNQLIIVGSTTQNKLLTSFNKSKEPCYLQFVLSSLKKFEIEALLKKNELQKNYAKFNICQVDLMQHGEKENFDNISISDDDIAKIFEFLDYKYAFKENLKIAFKNTVSALITEENNGENYNLEPKDLNINEQTLKSNEIGTIYHKVLEKVDFRKEYNDEDVIKLLSNLSIQQVVQVNEIKNVIQNVQQFVSNDDEILKEQPFVFSAKHSEITSSSCNEEVLVQGVIDLIIKKPNGQIIIIDYKYTNIKDAERLKQKYQKQLYLYKYATKIVTKSDNIVTYLYSIKQNKIIEV